MMNVSMPNQNQIMPGFQMQNTMMLQFMQQNHTGMMNQPQMQMNPVKLQTQSGRVNVNSDEDDFQDDQ
jgi:hypothetical protein